MRKELRYEGEVLLCNSRNWAYINTSGSIQIPHYCDVDIIVDENATCNISTTLNMAPNTGIKVYRGADLNLSLATLEIGDEDSHCPSSDGFWNGIDIFSGDAQHPPGVVAMYGSNIRNARRALNWVIYPFGPSYPGIVSAEACEFLNNMNSVNFYRSNSLFPQPADPRLKPTTFTECDFQINEEYEGEKFNEHIYLLNNSGLNFCSCSFTNLWLGTDGLRKR